MKIKKLLGSLVAGTAMLAIAGMASAATYQANVYGASAQFTFWNLQAVSYIQSQPGCSGANVYQQQADSTDQVNFATCGGNTYIIRVSSKASYDGILAVKGDNSKAGSTACLSTSTGYPGAALNPYYRLMTDETSCAGWTGGSGSCTALKCVRVNVGASDVAGESFTQTSSGTTNGPAGGAQLTMSFNGISTSGL